MNGISSTSAESTSKPSVDLYRRDSSQSIAAFQLTSAADNRTMQYTRAGRLRLGLVQDKVKGGFAARQQRLYRIMLYTYLPRLSHHGHQIGPPHITYAAMPMTPQAGRVPALPVFLLSSLPPWPRSSVPLWTTTVRPRTLSGPINLTCLSVTEPLPLPWPSVLKLPRSPT